MSYARPVFEDDFVNSYLNPQVKALGVDAKLRDKFVEFAIRHGGADERKFPPRLYHVIKGRTPSAYLAILILRFFTERRYEDFKRKTINHVEYLTSDGNTAPLENLVTNHSLSLRIIRIRMTNWVVTGKPSNIYITLRSPITSPDESSDGLTDEEIDSIFNQKLVEFDEWLIQQGHLPEKLVIETGEEIEISYRPDWLQYSDEIGYESDSQLGGQLAISDGVRILIFAKLKIESPYIHKDNLDCFYSLSDIFEGSTADDRAPKSQTFEKYWPRIITRDSQFARVFYTHFERFDDFTRTTIDTCFTKFAEDHPSWVEKAMQDRHQFDLESESDFQPSVEDAFHYQDVRSAFHKRLKPSLSKCWRAFTLTAFEILEEERLRARAHFEKMKIRFE